MFQPHGSPHKAQHHAPPFRADRGPRGHRLAPGCPSLTPQQQKIVLETPFSCHLAGPEGQGWRGGLAVGWGLAQLSEGDNEKDFKREGTFQSANHL